MQEHKAQILSTVLYQSPDSRREQAEEPDLWCGGKWYPEAAKYGDEKG